MDRLDLGGPGWTVRPVRGDVPGAVREAAPVPATVPGCVHADLLAAGLIEDPHGYGAEARLAWIGRSDWVYERRFEWTPTRHERVDLVCDGLDTVAMVSINGVEMGRTANMHRRYRFDMRGVLREGENVVAIAFAAPVDAAEAEAARLGDLPRVRDLPYNFMRKMACSFSWDWGPAMPTSGVWRPIAIEAWSGGRIGDVVPAVTLEERGARAALIDVNRELIHAFTVVQHLIARGDNRICSAFRNGLQLFVRQSRGFFYHHHATHKFRDVADFAVADVEVFNRSQSVNTIVGIRWNFPGTQQIFFDTNVV